MSVQLSQKMAQLIASGVDVRAAISGFKRLVYSGTIPATADTAISGTLLATLTASSGAATFETLPVWKVTIGGTVGGTVTIKIGGSPIHAAVTSVTDTPTTATLLAAAINASTIKQWSGWTAVASTSDVLITAPVGSGATLNALVLTSAVTASITATVAASGLADGTAGTTLGVAAANTCEFDALAAAGVLTSTQTWSTSSAAASGTAAWYRDIYATADTGTTTTAYLRKQGTVGAIGSGSDFELSSTTITISTPVTSSGATFTVPST